MKFSVSVLIEFSLNNALWATFLRAYDLLFCKGTLKSREKNDKNWNFATVRDKLKSVKLYVRLKSCGKNRLFLSTDEIEFVCA